MKLYPFQQEGVEFLCARPKVLRRKNRKLLADGMGLGKTIQVIAAAKRLGLKSGLIVCPASVKYNWKRKMIQWGLGSEETIHVINGSRDLVDDAVPFIVVNYDLLHYPGIHSQITARRFDFGAIDEAHRLKNPDSKTRKWVIGQKTGVIGRCRVKWFLTGTPIPNRPIEAWSILQSMVPWLIHPYEKWTDFGMRFCNGRHCYDGERGLRDPLHPSEQYNFSGASHITELRKRLKPFMLRRELSDVFKQLPPVIEDVVPLEVDIFKHPEIKEQLKNPMVLRTGEFDPEEEMATTTLRRIIAESKIPAVYAYLCDALQVIDKVLVFTYHRKVTEDLLQLFKEKQGKESAIAIYGGVSALKKQKLVDKFIGDPLVQVCICQISAGGEAVDGFQQVCAHVVFAEIDWSHGSMKQAVARLHRIGQIKSVQVVYLLAAGTLEARISDVLERKDYVISQLIRPEKKRMTIEELLIRQAAALEGIEDHLRTIAESLSPATSVPTSKVIDVPVEEDADVEDEDEKPVKTKKSDKKAKKGKAKPVEPEDEDEEEPEDEDEEEEKPKKGKAKSVTLEDLMTLCTKLVQTKKLNREEIRDLIKKTSKVKTLTEVDEKYYGKLKSIFEAELSDDGDDDEEYDD